MHANGPVVKSKPTTSPFVPRHWEEPCFHQSESSAESVNTSICDDRPRYWSTPEGGENEATIVNAPPPPVSQAKA